MIAVEVLDLVVRFGDKTAVNKVSFEAGHGQVTALLGPNGAGKTTTVETIEGYRSPDSGTVRVLGHDPYISRKAISNKVGVMLQGGGLYRDLNARRAIALWSAYYPDPMPTDELLDLVGLSSVASTPAKRLSGGEHQRLSLALALVGRPEVAFLDEPTAGIDPAGRLVVRDVVRSLVDNGSCVVLTTHELDEVDRIADHIVIMDHGSIVADGSPEALTAQNNEIRFTTTGDVDCPALGAALGAVVEETSRHVFVVETAPSPTALASLASWLAAEHIQLIDIQAGKSLEDVFLGLTRSRNAGHE